MSIEMFNVAVLPDYRILLGLWVSKKAANNWLKHYQQRTTANTKGAQVLGDGRLVPITPSDFVIVEAARVSQCL